MLREYVDQGGFIFAEACCDGEGFDRDFRQLATELFPDSPLRLMPPDHPVWFAEERVPAEFMRPLVRHRFLLPYRGHLLSGGTFLLLGIGGSATCQRACPIGSSGKFAAVLAIGANVLTYATNRQLKEKLEPTGDDPAALRRAARSSAARFYVAKLSHGGGSDDAPSALSNLLRLAGQQLELRVSSEKRLLSATDANLPDYPIVFLHGRRSFRFSPAERSALQRYLTHGGFLVGRFDLCQREFQRVVSTGNACDSSRSSTAANCRGTPAVDSSVSGIRHHDGAVARAASSSE